MRLVTRALVIGSPIAHSLSPILHAAGYEALGLTDWQYERAEVTASEVAEFVASLPSDVVGLSVTMPDKEAALDVADEVSELAASVGAANTLVRSASGWRADNTDVAGVIGALRDGGLAEAHDVVVIGGGATARSVLMALSQLGVQQVAFVVRREVRLETLELARRLGLSVDTYVEGTTDATFAMGFARLLVSTVPAEASPALAEAMQDAPLNRMAPGHAWFFDVAYADWPTPLARVTQQRGVNVISGLDMLVHQAARQFELFTGHTAPIADMMAAGRRAVEG